MKYEMFYLLNSQMVMQKVYLFPENLGESKNLNIGFMFVLILLIDIY